MSLLAQTPKLGLAKKLDPLVWVLTAVVYLTVIVLHRYHLPLPEGVNLKFLPAFNAVCNSLVAVCLIAALVFVKLGKYKTHAWMIQIAMVLSSLFLLSYITYNSTHSSTSYGGEGTLKTVYYSLLISHIILAALSLPLILKAYVFGVTNRFDEHRKLVKWVFPLWLFVALTGPACYLMLKPYY